MDAVINLLINGRHRYITCPVKVMNPPVSGNVEEKPGIATGTGMIR
jgi:hypothetical protein